MAELLKGLFGRKKDENYNHAKIKRENSKKLKGELMQVTLDLPEQYSLDASPSEWGQRIKLYAAMTLYQSGKLSAGAACEFAAVDRFTFISECAKLNISMIDYDDGELEDEVAALGKSA